MRLLPLSNSLEGKAKIEQLLWESKEDRNKKTLTDIPLFTRINDNDETDIIKALLKDYAKRS